MSNGLPCPATMLFNRLNRAPMPQTGREQMNVNNDDRYYDALK